MVFKEGTLITRYYYPHVVKKVLSANSRGYLEVEDMRTGSIRIIQRPEQFIPFTGAATISFTGSRYGMKPLQLDKFSELLDELQPKVLIHGDCIGADAQAHYIAIEKGIAIHKYPANIPSMWANTEGGEVMADSKNPLDRNKDIVNNGWMLISAPKGYKEEQRSEDWITVRYARASQRWVVIVWPNGKIGNWHGEYKNS